MSVGERDEARISRRDEQNQTFGAAVSVLRSMWGADRGGNGGPMSLSVPRGRVRPFDYHRQALRVERPRWWRPLAVLALAAVLYLIAGLLMMVPLAVLSMVVPGIEDWPDRAFASADTSDPLVAAFMLLAIAALLPAALLAVRLVGGRRPGTLSSVEGRIRGRLLVRCLGLAILLTLFGTLTFVTIEGGWKDVAITDRTLPTVALALLVVPLQAAAEEYVFRGLAMQTIGAWLRHPGFAIVLPIPLFTFGHEYDMLGLVDVTAFALAAGWLTWRTGGLEAAIGIHVANNAVLFVLGGFGLVDLNATEGTLVGLAFSLCLIGGYTWLVSGWADRPTSEGPEGNVVAVPAGPQAGACS